MFDIFSKRMKRQRGEFTDVYQYTELPETLRVQLVHVFTHAIGEPDYYGHIKEAQGFMGWINRTLCKEYGVFKLVDHGFGREPEVQDLLLNFILRERNHERVLDAVELLSKMLDTVIRDEDYQKSVRPITTADAALEEINHRFKENGVGYQYESGEIVRVDSQIIHDSAVKPALALLRDKAYQGPNEEFLRAHEHYRHSRYGEAMTDALKALESTIKVICGKRGWAFLPTDTAKPLLDVCFDNNLIPTYLQNHYSSLRAGLVGGVPTVRNKNSGHGQGAVPVQIPGHFAAYQLHLTASAILFLVESEKAMQ